MSLRSRLLAGWHLLRWREFAARPGHCPFCGATLLLRLQREGTSLRCIRCAASAVHMSIG
ncbi:MAG: hypothetical protein CVV14_08265 [Gammaproteobacteria bacterium HGW-Gammaproteobacteria-4]|jgi:hypothetical protein|nr:MAG: hypothetical protein CVV14_08265 [Gammaproteobacteria bacterium HGW-Gammaproteobacteria-4]